MTEPVRRVDEVAGRGEVLSLRWFKESFNRKDRTPEVSDVPGVVFTALGDL